MFSISSEERLSEIHPELARRVRAIDALFPALRIQVAQGLRTFEEQDALYAQGRTAPGDIVTHARGGESWHNYGIAVDLFPEDLIPGQPDWDSQNVAWQRMIGAGINQGLTSGSCWHGALQDNPHFQLTGRFPVSPDDEVRTLYAKGGLQLVWTEAFKGV